MEASLQHITYTEYLPALLGPWATPLAAATTYNDSVSAAVSVEFTTAAFRFGHSQGPHHAYATFWIIHCSHPVCLNYIE